MVSAIVTKPPEDGSRAGEEPAKARDRRTRRSSSLTLRILAINILALAILVGGVLYAGEYRKSLLTTELSALETRAQVFAAALAEGAVRGTAARDESLSPTVARQMMRRLAEASSTRARVFDVTGSLILDTRFMFGPGGVSVQVEDLPPLETPAMTLFQRALKSYDDAISWVTGHIAAPAYNENPIQQATDYEEVLSALDGFASRSVRASSGGDPMLTVAVPIQRYKQVLGAVMLTLESHELAQALLEVRLGILKVFGVALGVTILLSVYLAQTIARPLRRLAAAAERVGRGHHRQYAIPVFPRRRDEIGRLSRSLADMTEALWRRMDAIERFAADVAHEIKNPLTSVRSAVETAARVSDPEAQKRLMNIIHEDVSRLNRLISDISDASRLDAELSRAETEPVDLRLMLETLVSIHEATEGPPLELVKPLPTRSCIVPGVDHRLMQVFRNLIANAASFSPPGGRITVSLACEDKLVRATVDDEGPGIPPGKEEAIFERFYSERPQTEKFGTHSGLGLSISRQIVEAHGGRIAAANRLDEAGNVAGARFTVELPTVAG